MLTAGLCANADDIPTVFTWHTHFNPRHLMVEAIVSFYISILNTGLEGTSNIQVVKVSEAWTRTIADGGLLPGLSLWPAHCPVCHTVSSWGSIALSWLITCSRASCPPPPQTAASA